MRTPNLSAVVAGVMLIALGCLLVLNADGHIDLGFAYTGPAVVAALGALLLGGGLQARRRGRP